MPLDPSMPLNDEALALMHAAGDIATAERQPEISPLSVAAAGSILNPVELTMAGRDLQCRKDLARILKPTQRLGDGKMPRAPLPPSREVRAILEASTTPLEPLGLLRLMLASLLDDLSPAASPIAEQAVAYGSVSALSEDRWRCLIGRLDRSVGVDPPEPLEKLVRREARALRRTTGMAAGQLRAWYGPVRPADATARVLDHLGALEVHSRNTPCMSIRDLARVGLLYPRGYRAVVADVLSLARQGVVELSDSEPSPATAVALSTRHVEGIYRAIDKDPITDDELRLVKAENDLVA